MTCANGLRFDPALRFIRLMTSIFAAPRDKAPGVAHIFA